ncbi:MAG: YdcF family protein, partial [Eubacteriales bacterium]
MINYTDLQLAQILWNYHYLGHQPTKADCILGLGSYDIRVAEYCAELYKEKYAPLIIFSGNVGNWTRDLFKTPEAHIFMEQALKKGVPPAAILTEDRATNIGEN